MNSQHQQTEHTVYCDCGCGKGLCVNFKFTRVDDEVIIDTVTSGFSAHQNNAWWIFKRRLKAAWFMLRGKEYILHEVVANQYDWTKFVETINKLTEQNFIQKGD